MNRKTFSHIRIQLDDLKRLRGLSNSGLSDDLRQKMKSQAKKRFQEIKRTVQTKNLGAWLVTNFEVTLDELASLVDEM